MKLQPSDARLSERLPEVPEPSALTPQPEEARSPISVVSGAPVRTSCVPSLVVSPGEPSWATLESEFQPVHLQGTTCPLSETLLPFASVPEVRSHSFAAAAQTHHLLPLEQTLWSQLKMVDLGPIDALNYFCEQQRAQKWSVLEEEPEKEPGSRSLSRSLSPLSPRPLALSAVVPQPWDRL